MFIIIIVTFN